MTFIEAHFGCGKILNTVELCVHMEWHIMKQHRNIHAHNL